MKDKAPRKVVVAVPTGSLGAVELLEPEVDEIICLNIRSGSSFAVADAYENWYDLADEEVLKILQEKGNILEFHSFNRCKFYLAKSGR